ncbi:MAG: CAAD domain-containing protein [Cyanobacteriota bacterium]|nr:CAAD domain-containing protein [Cyanobacteriota bacterium]
MSDINTVTNEQSTTEKTTTNSVDNADQEIKFSERYSEAVGKVNETLNKLDWSQMGRIGKVLGIFAAVIVAQILIKGVMDTINLLPIVPGLLELLGVVMVGQWSWQNLTTSEKRSALSERVQSLRKEYLG